MLIEVVWRTVELGGLPLIQEVGSLHRDAVSGSAGDAETREPLSVTAADDKDGPGLRGEGQRLGYVQIRKGANGPDERRKILVVVEDGVDEAAHGEGARG